MEHEEAALSPGGHWVASQLQGTVFMWKSMSYLHQVPDSAALLDQIDAVLTDMIGMILFHQVKSVASWFIIGS